MLGSLSYEGWCWLVVVAMMMLLMAMVAIIARQ